MAIKGAFTGANSGGKIGLVEKADEGTLFEKQPFTTVNAELEFAELYRDQFLETIKSFSVENLTNIKIDRSDSGYIRDLGDMLLRVAYHESVHTGQ